ncbi:MAG: RICIN domain-containing protein [Clostridia bacterium]|nr:RICIN domain-containing protein [Clostridia bacterium]
MEPNYRIPAKGWLRYRHIPSLASGEEYILVMGSIMATSAAKPADYALRAKANRDGLEAFLFTEDNLRKKRSDRDLYWIITEEGDGLVSLRSVATGKYINITDQGAWLSRKKQLLTLRQNGSMYRFFVRDKEGKAQFLHASLRDEVEGKVVFTAANKAGETTFALLKRAEIDLPLQPQGKPILTAGSYADVHIDYGLQLKPPYMRKDILKTARAYRTRYDLDAIIMCGDNMSDNGSHFDLGAMQGHWPYSRWQSTRARLDKALRGSFRNPEKADNILYLTGNHEYQAGDRQPEGQTFNSAYYTDLLPQGVTHKIYQQMKVDQGPAENLLCYQYRIGDVFFLVLNDPAYPFIKWRFPERSEPGHTLEQAQWLEERLKEIEQEKGNKAIIFVSSHFPFTRGEFSATYDVGHPNMEAYYRMDRAMMRFPNLFYFYGHVHGGDRWVTLTHSAETMGHLSPVEMSLEDNGEFLDLTTQESSEREKFRSDVILSQGFHHIFTGSLAFFSNGYFATDGKKLYSTLSAIECPFFQGLVIEVYEDRVVLTMQNFGTKKETLACLKNGTYKLKPLTCPLVK